MSSSTTSDLTPAAAATLVENDTNEMLSRADAAAASRVQSLALVHGARVSRLTRTAAAAAAQFGATSTQAVAAERDLTVAQSTAGRFAILQRQASTTLPVVTNSGWALHGRVYDAAMEPRSGYTVFFVDDQKKYQSALGFAYTDDTGYFSFKTTAKSTGGARSKSQASSSHLFVEIANTAGQPVYLSHVPFQPSIGNAIYQNITLPAGEPVLGDPPKTIRSVALPPEDPES